MSPVFILSRLCLKRRFQFFGISVEPPVSALRTTPTSFSPITLRRPTWSAFSHGTCTVMSLCRILIVRYSRFCPRTSRDSFLMTVPAPWCGYTTLSPTLYKPTLPFVSTLSRQKEPALERHRPEGSILAKTPWRSHFFDLLGLQTAKAAGPGRRDCPPGAASGLPESPSPGRPLRPRPPRARAGRPGRPRRGCRGRRRPSG